MASLCGTPQQECFEYINTDVNNEFYQYCPNVNTCPGQATAQRNILPTTTPSITEIDIFPNPGTNQIRLNGGFENLDVEILNLQGQMMFSQTDVTTFTTINVESLPSGLYYLRVTLPNEYKTEVIRWVKQ